MSRLSNHDVNELIRMQYEDALGDDEPWAVESYEYRRKVVKSAVTPAADDGLASVDNKRTAKAGTTTQSGRGVS